MGALTTKYIKTALEDLKSCPRKYKLALALFWIIAWPYYLILVAFGKEVNQDDTDFIT